MDAREATDCGWPGSAVLSGGLDLQYYQGPRSPARGPTLPPTTPHLKARVLLERHVLQELQEVHPAVTPPTPVHLAHNLAHSGQAGGGAVAGSMKGE